MASVIGNLNSWSNNNNNSSNLVLKPEAAKKWYMYWLSPHTEIKPYPAFDQAGNPLPLITGNTESEYSNLSSAFVLLQMAAFGGMDGRLNFVDFCSDMDDYLQVGEEYIPTPYTAFIRNIMKLIPDKNNKIRANVSATPRTINAAKRHLNYSRTNLLFRGALAVHKGAPVAAKSAASGVLLNCLFCCGNKSAITGILSELARPKDPMAPLSVENSHALNLGGPGGLLLKMVKSGAESSAPHTTSLAHSDRMDAAIAEHFSINPTDPAAYFNAIHMSYGPWEQIDQMLHIMTTAEMFNMLKENYPISWLFYGLKDSPYAKMFTEEDKQKAYADPDMAEAFGLVQAPIVATSAVQPAPVAQPQAYTSQFPTNYWNNASAPASSPAPAPQQVAPQQTNNYWANTPAQPPVNPTPVVAPQPAGNIPSIPSVPTLSGSTQDRMKMLAAKYGSSHQEEDEIPY